MKSRGVIEEPVPGVLAFAPAPHTWHQALYIATLASGSAGVGSHRSAAAMHGVDGVEKSVLEVSVLRGVRLRIPGVIVHQVSVPIPPEDIVEIDGIRCTSFARTLVDLASVVAPRALERAVDDFERRGFSLTWLEQVATRLHRPGQRGTKRILAEVDRRRQRGQVRGSWFEKLVEECLSSNALPPLAQQHEIRDGVGRFICRVDLAIPDVKLAIECHSRSFHTGTHAELVDQRRENRAMLEGWQFLYLGWADRKTPREARQFLEKLITRRRVDAAS
jgi:hypothetical protein